MMQPDEITMFYVLRKLIEEARPYRGELPLRLDKAFESAEETFGRIEKDLASALLNRFQQKREGATT